MRTQDEVECMQEFVEIKFNSELKSDYHEGILHGMKEIFMWLLDEQTTKELFNEIKQC